MSHVRLVSRESFHDAVAVVTESIGGDVEAREALRGIVVYVMALESALDRTENARRDGRGNVIRPNMPNPWTFVSEREREYGGRL